MAATSDALLEHVTAAPEEAAIFLDFDGVLAPIVQRPEDAYPPAETRTELLRLTGRYPLVAVVSGRAGDDVRERVAVDGIVYVGSHGLELDRQADRWRQQIVDFSGAAPWPPSETELKGLVYGLTEMPHDRDKAWYLRPAAVAIVVGVVLLVLNFWFA